jgi:hypothetical protein
MNDTLDIRTVLTDQASALIRAELRAGNQRKSLESAVWSAINDLGRSADEVSEATGLTPAEVRRIAGAARDLDLDALVGSAA